MTRAAHHRFHPYEVTRPLRPASARKEVATGVLVAAAMLVAPTANSATAGSLGRAADQPQQESTFAMELKRSRSGPTAKSNPALLGRTDSTPVHILVKLDYDPIVDYPGDIPGLAATSPNKTGMKLKQNKAVDAYTRYVATYESKVLDEVVERIPEAKVHQSFRTIYGGVAMTLPANRIGDLLSIEGVVAVQPDSLERPLSAPPRPR